MKKVISLLSSYIGIFISLIGSLTVLWPVSPLNAHFIDRDPGVFLYMGRQILNGEIPYKDIWDHKPPLIFYINALGQLITPNSPWGVWLIELILLFTASYISYNLIKSLFSKEAAIFSTMYWLLALFFIIRLGNLTEEFALPIQFFCIWLFIHAQNKRFSFRRGIVFGITFAFLFLLKQTNIGIAIAILLVLIFLRLHNHQQEYLLKEIIGIVLGFIAISTIVLIYFGSQNALADFWNNAFLYNFSYTSTEPLSALLASMIGLVFLMPTGILVVSFIGLILAIITICKDFKLNDVKNLILLLASVDFLVELLLISTSGRAYEHYYITLLPAISIFTAFVFQTLIMKIKETGKLRISSQLITAYALIVIGIGVYNSYFSQVQFIQSIDDRNITEYITSHTGKGETVLFYGAETSLNFETQRTSPSKFVYQYPLYTSGYTSDQLILEFLNDILVNQPAMIIDTHNAVTPFFEFPIRTKEIEENVKLINSKYAYIGKLAGWDVYQLKKFNN